LLVTASVVPISQILATLMMEALSSSETSVFTRATRHNIPEDAFFNYDLNLHDFHGDDYEEWCLLGCYAVWLL
jgi:hypothetical protein